MLFAKPPNINSAKAHNIMPRIASITIPDNKQIGISLTYVFGIGRPLALRILKQLMDLIFVCISQQISKQKSTLILEN